MNNLADINGIKLNHISIGNGRPILVMHGGLGLDHNYLRPYLDRLSRVGKVIYYDHRGNGLSTAITAPDQLNFDILTRETPLMPAPATPTWHGTLAARCLPTSTCSRSCRR